MKRYLRIILMTRQSQNILKVSTEKNFVSEINDDQQFSVEMHIFIVKSCYQFRSS